MLLDQPFVSHPSLIDGDRPSVEDTAPFVPKAIVTAAATPMAPPATFDWDRQVIYELHVRGFTRLHPDIPPDIRGTFAALGHPAVLAHLRRLGVTTVELLPCAAWTDDRHLPALGLHNYWGYNPVAMMAPDPRLAPGGWEEIRTAVAALQGAGIAVLVDAVLNHTGESDELGPTLSMRGLDNALYYRLLPGDAARYVNDAGCGNVLALDRPQVVRLAMASFRTWIERAGIDGFRLDLAPVLGRRDTGFDPAAPLLSAMAQDPLLASRVVIAEPWDIGPGGYQLGSFPPQWGEWNDRYRDTMRRFWRGDGGLLGELATRLAGSADIFAGRRRRPTRSINFITAHDGFTLADLVSYETKHNEANRENNNDGSGENFSWNNGAEGETDDPAILTARRRDIRGLLATLLCSRGTPMFPMGDEAGRTQRGNNNPYAQDNESSWFDWASVDPGLVDFASRMIALRLRCPALSDGHTLTGRPVDASGIPDVSWHLADGGALSSADWQDPGRRTLVVALYAGERQAYGNQAPGNQGAGSRAGTSLAQGSQAGVSLGGGEQAHGVQIREKRPEGSRAVIVLHAGSAPVDMTPPDPRPGWCWHIGIDSGDPGRQGPVEAHPQVSPRSVLVLVEEPNPGLAIGRALPADALAQLAQGAGIAPNWWSVDGRETIVGDDTNRALLAAMRLPAGTPSELADSLHRVQMRGRAALPPAVVGFENQPIVIRVGFSARRRWLTVHREDGGFAHLPIAAGDARSVTLPALPCGRHQIMLDGEPDATCRLTVAPRACFMPDALTDGGRRFGVAAHLYTIRRTGDAGIGDFTALGMLGKAATGWGASILGLNPMHARFPGHPDRASPYHPSDRRFLDPIYLDVERIAGPGALAGRGAGDAAGRALGVASGGAGAENVDYARVWAAKAAVLREAFQAGGAEDPAFRAFFDAGGSALRDFARFEALAGAQGSPHWQAWPAELRHPNASGVTGFAQAHAGAVQFSAWLQFQCERQLAAAASTAPPLGFYRDLAVGSAPDGAEAWSRQDALLTGVSVGSPPDPFSASGQVWSLPPSDPLAMAAEGYAGFAELLSTNMRHAGALRIDHVMGLQRLFLVPDGARATEGAYLTYPLRDLIGQLTLESQRARCLVVGEDLGTVPEGFSETMQAASVLSYSVLWFERESADFIPPDRWRARAAACVSTHDLPTLAGWWTGADIAEQHAIGLMDAAGLATAQAERARDKQRVVELLRREGLLAASPDPDAPMPPLLAGAVHALIARTPAALALVQADDLAGETHAVNLPGTDRERPNWRRRLRLEVDALFGSPIADATKAALRGDPLAAGRFAPG